MLASFRNDDNGYGSTDLDKAYHILSNQRRRHIVRALMHKPRMDKRDLRELVTEQEVGKPFEQIQQDSRQCVRVSLHQCHIPKLEDYGIIQIDRNVVSQGPTFEETVALLPDKSLGDKFKNLF